jgi:hypothetical protein
MANETRATSPRDLEKLTDDDRRRVDEVLRSMSVESVRQLVEELEDKILKNAL